MNHGVYDVTSHGHKADPFRLTGASRRVLLMALLSAVIAGLSAIGLLALSGWFLTAAAVAGATGTVAAFNYLVPSAFIRALAIARTVSRYGERLLSHRAALTGMAQLRGQLFGALASQDSRTAPDLSGGDASARLIGDIESLEDLVVRRPTRPANVVAALLAIGLTLFAGWPAALALALALAGLPLLLRRLAERLLRAPAVAAAAAQAALRIAWIDYAAARPEIIAYGLGDRVTAALIADAQRLDRARAALFRGEAAVASMQLGYAALVAGLVLALAEGGAAYVALALLAATASVEAMAAFARTAVRQASVEEGLARLAGLLALDGTPAADITAAPMMLALGAVRLAPGDRVAITGVSGSGKTRLLEAIAGLRPAVHAIAIGDVPIDSIDAGNLRAQTALSPQDATLIAGTIADNLRLARPRVTTTDMQAVLHIACLDARVAAMPAGLDTLLGEGGGTLSGGERKRLSLARALLANRPWLLLDEPTEGLDSATEADLVQRLGGWLDATGTGLLVVSHRRKPLALATRSLAIGDCETAASLPDQSMPAMARNR